MSEQQKENEITLRAENVVSTPSIEVRGTLRQKSAFAVQHMMAAARFSRLCGDVEIENAGKPLGSHYDQQIAYVSATVMLSVASLESNINEYLGEPNQFFPELQENVRNTIIRLLDDKAILEKYQHVLAIKGVDLYKKGEAPYQDIDALIKLRNALVHFKPEWHDEQELHKKIEGRLKGRFDINPFIGSAGVFFPQQCMIYGCTKWAVRTSVAFMRDFSDRTGLPCRFDQFAERINPVSDNEP